MTKPTIDDMGPLPRIHRREKLITEAENNLRAAIQASGIRKMELTTAEYLQVLARIMHDEISGTLKSAIRQERHGDTDKPGGLE